MTDSQDTPLALLKGWLDMLANVGDPKAFRSAQEVFNRNYKRANHAEQGAYHQLLAEDHQRAMGNDR